VSLPGMLRRAPALDRCRWAWRTPLERTRPFWDGWCPPLPPGQRPLHAVLPAPVVRLAQAEGVRRRQACPPVTFIGKAQAPLCLLRGHHTEVRAGAAAALQ
jgi:hypothetical protein